MPLDIARPSSQRDQSQTLVLAPDRIDTQDPAHRMGFALTAYRDAGVSLMIPKRKGPHEIGAIPNLAEFSRGLDIVGNQRAIKSPHVRAPEIGSALFLPEFLAPFLPFVQMAANYEKAYRGAAAFEKLWATIRPSRHISLNAAHQPHFAHMHDHKINGPSSYFAGSDAEGTVFGGFQVSRGAVCRWEESDKHRSPIINGRRTFVVVGFYENMPDRANSFLTHKFPIDGGTPGKASEWRAAANKLMARTYSPEAQRNDLLRWQSAISLVK